MSSQASLVDHATSASLLLLLLLFSADIAFIALHVLNALTPIFNNPLLNIEKDAGYSEILQYLKYFWASLVFMALCIKGRSWHFMAWALVLLYLLADDSLGLHEQIGSFISNHIAFAPPWGLRPHDIGELICAMGTGLVLSGPLALAYWKGVAPFRKASIHLAQLAFTLAFFGVVVDLLHMTVQSGWKLKFMLAIVEDGGEMLAVSIIFAYSHLLFIRQGVPPGESPWQFAKAKLAFKNNATSVQAS